MKKIMFLALLLIISISDAKAGDYTFCAIQDQSAMTAYFSAIGPYYDSVERDYEKSKGLPPEDLNRRGSHVTLCYPYKTRAEAEQARAENIQAYSSQGGFSIIEDKWSPTNSRSQPSQASGKYAPARCLSAKRKGLHMAISNNCGESIEVAFCYKQDSNDFLCARKQFGQVSVRPGQSSGVSLPSSDGPGKILMIGCVAPSIPGKVTFDGKEIRAKCW